MIDLDDCQRSLQISFDDESLLLQALVHSSYLNEDQDFALPSNERLEFLGDAVLGLVVAERLYDEFPGMDEGKLSALRASLVCRETLAGIASALNLGEWFLMGQGEEAAGGRNKPGNLANGVEALLGAIYLDRGLGQVREFIFRHIEPLLEQIKSGETSPNYKALLQDFTQKEKGTVPLYRVVEVSGPEHDKQFTVEVLVDGEVMGVGKGKSKKAAEMEASQSAWVKVRCNHG
jgi:ribonuclease-3